MLTNVQKEMPLVSKFMVAYQGERSRRIRKRRRHNRNADKNKMIYKGIGFHGISGSKNCPWSAVGRSMYQSRYDIDCDTSGDIYFTRTFCAVSLSFTLSFRKTSSLPSSSRFIVVLSLTLVYAHLLNGSNICMSAVSGVWGRCHPSFSYKTRSLSLKRLIF